MKKSMILKPLFALTVGCLVTASVLRAQAQPAGAPPPPPPGNDMMAPPPGTPAPMPSQQPLQTVSTFKGTVAKLATNDDYVYDGFYMLSNGDSLLVKFPPHLGAQITSVAKAGTTVSLTGVMNTAPRGEKEVRMLTLTAGGTTLADTTARTAQPPADTYVSGNGTVTALQTNREGTVNGVVVDGKTILRIPPHIANQLTALKANGTVAYTGMKKPVTSGEISAANYAIVHCKTITVNGTQYLVQ